MRNKYNPLFKDELNQAINISEELCNLILESILDIRFPVINHVDTFLISIVNSIKKTKAILKLISLGYENEAFILWRSLHEEECILFVLYKYGEVATKAFEEHEDYMTLKYENVESNSLLSKETIDKIKSDILIVKTKLTKEMSRYNTKDKSGFVDYGWLLAIDDFNDKFQKKELNLSFAGGLQKFSEQDQTNQEFIYSSKYIHPTFHSQKNKKNRDLLDLVLIDTMNSLKNIQSIFDEFIVRHKLIESHHQNSTIKQMTQTLNRFNSEFSLLIGQLNYIVKIM